MINQLRNGIFEQHLNNGDVALIEYNLYAKIYLFSIGGRWIVAKSILWSVKYWFINYRDRRMKINGSAFTIYFIDVLSKHRGKCKKK